MWAPVCRSVCNFIRTSMHHEYDSPWGIGAIDSETRLTAPMPWGEIVFMMNTDLDEITDRD